MPLRWGFQSPPRPCRRSNPRVARTRRNTTAKTAAGAWLVLSLLAYQMLQILIVLGANIFENFLSLPSQIPGVVNLPRLRIRPRIVDREFDFQMAEVRPPVALRDMQLLAAR